MGYLKQTIVGTTWVSAFRIASRMITFLRVIILARLLTPSQFGLFGIASLVLVFIEVITETGINIILIQQKLNVDRYISSAWIVSIIRGFLISFVIIIFSPLIIVFFHSPQAKNLLLLISIVPIIRGFINPSIVKLQKELRFKKEFIIRIAIFFVDSLVAVTLSVVTKSAVSIVWGLMAGAILEVVLSFLFFRPFPKFEFIAKLIKEIFHRGKWSTLHGIFNYFAQEGDNIVVGRILGASTLGIYDMAYTISTLPISEVADVVNRVTFPVYVQIEHDRRRLQRAFIKSTMAISVASLLISSFVFFFPKEIIIILLGQKWILAVPLLRILALYGFLRAVSGPASVLFLSVGKQKYVAGMTFFRFITLAITIYPFVVIFGVMGAAYCALLSVFVEIPVIAYYTLLIFKQKTNISVKNLNK